ncbi:MAG: chromate transporter [Vulcanimicrobiaceae bacterium]|jgi:chromate transporter
MVYEIGRLGLLGFGGVGPQSYHLFVQRTQWLSAEEFAELAGVGQALPGANTVNLVAICGDRWHGAPGAVLAVTALVIPPTLIAMVLAALIAPFAGAARLVAIECAIVAACAGLILATALRVFKTIRRRRLVAFAIGGVLAAAVLWRSADMPEATLVAVGIGFACESLARGRAA